MIDANKFLRIRTRVFHDVLIEAARASEKFGNENLDGCRPDLVAVAEAIKLETDAQMENGETTWSAIIAEEFMEVLTEEDPVKRRAELVQLAAVAVRWAEAIDRRAGSRDPKRRSVREAQSWIDKIVAGSKKGAKPPMKPGLK